MGNIFLLFFQEGKMLFFFFFEVCHNKHSNDIISSLLNALFVLNTDIRKKFPILLTKWFFFLLIASIISKESNESVSWGKISLNHKHKKKKTWPTKEHFQESLVCKSVMMAGSPGGLALDLKSGDSQFKFHSDQQFVKLLVVCGSTWLHLCIGNLSGFCLLGFFICWV